MSQKRTRLLDINGELTCNLCNGYFIDATTITECLHSFCKSCIVKHLEANKCCPICEVPVPKTKPLSSIRSDKTLQDLVYKIIPDVFKNEMKRRRDFYTKHSEAAPTTSEDRGEVADHRMFYMPNDKISLSLEYGYGENQIPKNGYESTTPSNQQKATESETMRRYLLCPAGLSILHLKKFIATKYGLPNTYEVEVMYLEDILSEDYTLMDVAYIYAWRRSDPMRLFYRICERPIKRLKTTHPQTIESKSGSGSSLNNTNSDSNLSNTTTNNKSVSQSKLAASTTSTASTSTSNTSTLTTIMTGAATLPALATTTTPTLKALNTSINSNSINSSNNSGATGVTSTKGSTATPKNADTSTKSASVVNACRVTSSPTTATPQDMLSASTASAVQTDEPPKKLRKILPNNSSASTPKAVPISSSNCATTPTTQSTTTTSSSTVTSLRQCRINTDKNKSMCSSINSNAYNTGLSASKTLSKEETKFVSIGSPLGSVRKNSSRKSSAFDVRTLIGTKSPTLPCNQQFVESAISGNECKDEKGINHKNSANTNNTNNSANNSNGTAAVKQAAKGNTNTNSSVRDMNRNAVAVSSTFCSMPSTLSSLTTGSNKKLLSNSSSVAISRPPTNTSASPTNSSASPNGKTTTPATSSNVELRPFVPLKITKSGTFVSPKQLNAKSLKASQNDLSVKTCNTISDVTSDNRNTKISNKPITTPKSAPQMQSNRPQRQSTPLSPPSIRIKLPPPPTTKNSTKLNPVITNKPTSLSSLTSSVSNNNNNNNKMKEQTHLSTQQPKQTESSRLLDLNHSVKDSSQSNIKKQLSDAKSAVTHKSVHNTNQSHSKSSISQTHVTKTKGASINQIVNKIASGVTAKSASVNVTSTTPTLELSKTNSLALGSAKVTANEVNDDKVSTTTNESGVSSSMHKNQEESAIKAVTSATTNTGNLVIRISTKSHSVESCASLKDKERNNSHKVNKFEIKRDIPSLHSSKLNTTITGTDGNSHKNNVFQSLNAKKEKSSECVLKSVSHKSHNNNDEEDEDDDDNSIDGRKLVVDVPTEDSYENEVGTTKVTFEMSDDIDSGRGSDIIRLSCDDIEIGSPQSTTLSIKTPESDISSKLALNITSTTTLSANSAVLASPPPTPSPKSESDPCVTMDTKSNTSSSSNSPNGPLDLSMSTNKKDSHHQKIASPPISMRAIYDIPPPKPKHCVNPAVLDKHRGLFPPSTAPNKQHPSFKIMPTPSHTSRQTPPQASATSSTNNLNNSTSKKERSINTSILSSSPTTGSNQSNSSSSSHSRNRSPSHHHSHHHQHKNYSVITPDPHRYTPKIVIRNIGSPPSITSHFNYQTHH